MSDARQDDDEKPLDPAMEAVRRKMVRLLALSFGITMVGLMTVLGTIVYKMSSSAKAPAPAQSAFPAGGAVLSADIVLPKGAYLNGQSLSGDRLSLDITLPGGAREIAVYDVAAQRFVARFTVKAE